MAYISTGIDTIEAITVLNEAYLVLLEPSSDLVDLIIIGLICL